MQFLKKNYEKILLSIVLVGLMGTVVFLVFYVAAEKQDLAKWNENNIKRPVKPLEEPDLSPTERLLARAALPLTLDLTSTNRLFNPLRWQKGQNGQLFVNDPGNAAKLLQVTKSTPLYFTVALESVSMVDPSAPRYVISVDQQANSRTRGKRSLYLSVGEKKDPVMLREIKGPPDNPTSVILELTDTGDTISVSKDKPYRRVDSYVVDLKYVPENRTFTNKRVDSTFNVGGSDYKIVAITQDEVVISAPNQKHSTIKFSAVP